MAAHIMECLIQSSDGTRKPIVSQTHAIPQIRKPHDVLVRVAAVALNPTDFKSPESNPKPGAIIGCDFTGTVVSTGSSTEGLQVGQRVCGFVHGSNPGNPDIGSFAEFLVADSRLLIKVPDTWSDKEAAALGGVGWGTVALAIEKSLQLAGRPSNAEMNLRADGKRPVVLVSGGATATGTMACQLLASAGCDPIATVSPANSTLVKSYGAVSTIDYTAPSCGDTIKEQTKGTLRYAIDCITSPESVATCFEALGRAGARISALDHIPDAWRTRKAVKIDFPLGYTLFGSEVQLQGAYHRDADHTKMELGQRWRDEVQQLVDHGQLKCHPPRELSNEPHGRWESIIQGLEMLKAGEVHAQKLVVRLM
ncbi:alcohol dehydrogenase GroES-like domain-containing protein [Pseudovirgaria hyperparasitica]|uniref:Alcohol dehydrogenase GroES-like domain-containing protein n=1 Tax=Pseudovirgaria hyperparasitica TaxID=470096 RepID=A0A6A6WJA7_9PEZI|nr:alcohol dehydrogenase GroES-like domain-containing protein [Pseudovirgaria hyperparasitica]KAF2761847.1 alcohol dehydrogenase GroES-like domain-containing protein [Pseudovirgaria hyperparasitica]